MIPENTQLATTNDAPLLSLINSPAIIKRFEMAVGAQAGSVITNIINAANTNPAILECEPNSVITAGLNAAAMKLSLSPSLGQAAILPFDNNVKQRDGTWAKVKKAQLIVMVRGIKAMAMRTNKYRVLNAFDVRAGQEVVIDQMTGKMSIIGKATAETVIGYGAYLQLFNGYEASVYWTVEQLWDHARQYSKTYDNYKKEFKPSSQWVTNFDRMAKKTVLRDLIMNHGVIDENDRAMLEANEDAAATAEQGTSFADMPDTIDGTATDVISQEEAEYITACEMTTPKGSELGKLNDEQLLSLTLSKHADLAKAAQVVINWRKNHKPRTEAQLLQELGL